jgi:hypothetical protein
LGWLLKIERKNTRVDGLQIYDTSDLTYQYPVGIYITSTGAGDIRISNNIIKGGGTYITPGGGAGAAIWASTPDTAENSAMVYQIWNNIGYNFNYNLTDAGYCGLRNESAGKSYVYNNTFYNNRIGISHSSYTFGQAIAKNNAVFGNFADFVGPFTTLDYNASDEDISGTDQHWVNISPNTNGESDATGWVKAFTDYANGDFSIKSMSSPLYNSGTSISIVINDILGNKRPIEEKYDIGAFELSPLPNYRMNGHIEIQGHVEFK